MGTVGWEGPKEWGGGSGHAANMGEGDSPGGDPSSRKGAQPRNEGPGALRNQLQIPDPQASLALGRQMPFRSCPNADSQALEGHISTANLPPSDLLTPGLKETPSVTENVCSFKTDGDFGLSGNGFIGFRLAPPL